MNLVRRERSKSRVARQSLVVGLNCCLCCVERLNSQVSFRRCTSDVLFSNLIIELRSFVNKESFLFALKYTGKQLDRACTAVDLMK